MPCHLVGRATTPPINAAAAALNTKSARLIVYDGDSHGNPLLTPKKQNTEHSSVVFVIVPPTRLLNAMLMLTVRPRRDNDTLSRISGISLATGAKKNASSTELISKRSAVAATASINGVEKPTISSAPSSNRPQPYASDAGAPSCANSSPVWRIGVRIGGRLHFKIIRLFSSGRVATGLGVLAARQRKHKKREIVGNAEHTSEHVEANSGNKNRNHGRTEQNQTLLTNLLQRRPRGSATAKRERFLQLVAKQWCLDDARSANPNACAKSNGGNDWTKIRDWPRKRFCFPALKFTNGTTRYCTNGKARMSIAKCIDEKDCLGC
jgi:hypothetical protein